MQNNGFNLELNLKTLCCFWLQIKWLQKDLIHHDFKNLNFRPGCRETQNLSGHFATSKNVSNSLILAGLYDEKHETGTFQFSRVCKSYPPPWAVRGGGGGGLTDSSLASACSCQVLTSRTLTVTTSSSLPSRSAFTSVRSDAFSIVITSSHTNSCWSKNRLYKFWCTSPCI